MKVAHVTWHGGLGGASKLVFDLSLGMKDKLGYELTVVYATQGKELGGRLADNGIRVYQGGMRSGLDPIGAYRVFKFLRHNKFDIVHLHYFTPLLRMAVILGARHRTLITTRHVYIDYEGPFWYYRLFNNLLSKPKDVLVGVSSSVFKEILGYRRIDRGRAMVISNGVDTTLFRKDNSLRMSGRKGMAISEDEIVIGTVRGLDSNHGVDHLIKAIPFVKQSTKRFRVCIVGDGVLRSEYEQLACDLHVADQVAFLGSRTDIPEILNCFDIFVMPSKNESFGIAAIEAMSTALPVVAYAVGGLVDVIEDGITGVLIPFRDPKALAQALIQLCNSRELREAMGEAGRKRVKEHFSLDLTLRRYSDIYELALKSAKSRGASGEF